MTDLKRTLDALKNTSKGQLKYDRNRLEESGIESIIEQCTSPPKIRNFSPQSSKISRNSSKKRSPSPNSFRRDEIYNNKGSNSVSPKDSKDLENHLKILDVSPKINNRDQSCEQKQIIPDRKRESQPGSSPKFRDSPPRLPESEDNKMVSAEAREEVVVSPDVTRVEVALKSCEDEWAHQSNMALAERRKLYEKQTKMLARGAEIRVTELYLRKEHEAKQQLHRAQQQNISGVEEVKVKQQRLRESHKQHARMLDVKMREAEAKRIQEENEQKKRNEEIAQRLAAMVKVQQDIEVLKQKATDIISGCPHLQHIGDLSNKCVGVMSQILTKVTSIIEEAKISSPNAVQIQLLADLHQKAKNAVDFANNIVEMAGKKAKEEEVKAAAAATAATQAAAATAATQAAAATAATQAAAATAATQAAAATAAAASIPTSSISQGPPAGQKDEIKFVQEDMFKEYERLQNQQKQVEAACQPIITDPNLKKYKFDLQKAVNIPVNAISPTNGAHLRDKLTRLRALLSGQHVDVAGKRVSATDHPAGTAFVKDLFARKIVKQGDEQVSSNFESAFAIAAVTAGLCVEFGDVTQLLLSHFHAKCPYLVPYYKPKLQNQTEEDYYKSLGYSYKDGVREKQDKFLKRMSGMMRLYASIMVAVPPQGPNHPHPHGLENAWMWLTRTMNLHPRPDITATLLYDLLQVTGHALIKTYNKQALKLLHLIVADFMPRVKQVTPQGAGGPVVRLENYLQKCIAQANIPPPDGILSQNFWYT